MGSDDEGRLGEARDWAGLQASSLPTQQAGGQEQRSFQAKDTVHQGVATRSESSEMMCKEARTPRDLLSPILGQGGGSSPGPPLP